MFNEGQYVARTFTGELQFIIKKSRPTQMPEIRNWIPGTQSQEIHFLDKENNLIVRAHRFWRPDGFLAASGMIDPKAIFLNGEWFRLVTRDEP